MNNDPSSIYGKGFAYPLQGTQKGPKVVSEEDIVRSSIHSILGTRVGERPFCVKNGVMYGVRIADGLFDTMTQASDIIPFEVKRALEVWEPRIIVQGVYVNLDPDNANRVMVLIQYVLRATNRSDNLVKPYRLRKS